MLFSKLSEEERRFRLLATIDLPSSEKTLEDGLFLFLSSKSNARTVLHYENSLRAFVQMFRLVRDRPRLLHELTTMHVEVYITDLKNREVKLSHNTTRPSRRAYKGDGLSPVTIRNNIKDIKHFFKWLYKRGLTTTDLARDIDVPSVPREYRELPADYIATDEEMTALIAVAEGNPLYYALVLFLYDTACRIGEVADLRAENVDLRGWSALVDGKTGPRKTYFRADCASAMRRYLYQFRPAVSHNHFFCVGRKPHGPFLSHSVSGVIERLSEKAELGRILRGNHIRHKRAMELYEISGGRVDVAAAAVGNSPPVFEERYRYTDPTEVERVMKSADYRRKPHEVPADLHYKVRRIAGDD